MNLGTEPRQDLSQRNSWPTLRDLPRLENRVPICIGSGPSLDENGHELAFVDRDRFVLVATDSALRFLDQHNIVPDWVVSSEIEGVLNSKRAGTETLLQGCESRYLGRPLLAPYFCNPAFTRLWVGPIHWYVDAGWKYGRWADEAPTIYPENAVRVVPQWPTVGGHALACCESLGAQKIILIGYDWGLSEDRHHCEGYNGPEHSIQARRRNWEQLRSQWRHRSGMRWTQTDIEVLNCTAYGHFPQAMTLEEATA